MMTGKKLAVSISEMRIVKGDQKCNCKIPALQFERQQKVQSKHISPQQILCMVGRGRRKGVKLLDIAGLKNSIKFLILTVITLKLSTFFAAKLNYKYLKYAIGDEPLVNSS